MYENYAKMRDEQGFSDYQISKEIGVSRSVFSDWKSGRHNPSKKSRAKISKVLNLPPVDYFFSSDRGDYFVETKNNIKRPEALYSRTAAYCVQLANGKYCELSKENYEKLQEDIDIYIESWLKSKKLV